MFVGLGVFNILLPETNTGCWCGMPFYRYKNPAVQDAMAGVGFATVGYFVMMLALGVVERRRESDKAVMDAERRSGQYDGSGHFRL